MHAEFADVDGGVVKLRPALGEGEGDVDAVGVPAGEAVLLDEELSGEGGLLFEVFGDVFGGGGVGDVAEGLDGGVGPGGSLVGEGEGLVVVEGVDDVGKGERLEGEEVFETGPAGSAGDDGVVGGDAADLFGDEGLDALPAVGVGLLGLVHDLEEDVVGIERCEVGCEGAPEHGESLHWLVSLE